MSHLARLPVPIELDRICQQKWDILQQLQTWVSHLSLQKTKHRLLQEPQLIKWPWIPLVTVTEWKVYGVVAVLPFLFSSRAPNCTCLVHFWVSAITLSFLGAAPHPNTPLFLHRQQDGNPSPRQPLPTYSFAFPWNVWWDCPWSGAILRGRSLEQSLAWQEMDSVV
jgi:hypothetical protein